jgi:hypothetical protein
VAAGRSLGAPDEIRVLISNYEIPAADQGPFPPFIVDNRFTIPGIGTFTLLPRRSVTYADNGGYKLSINHIRGGERGLVVSRYRVDDGHALALIDRSLVRGTSVHLSATLPAPGIELVVVSRSHEHSA